MPPVFLYVEDDPLSREVMEMMLGSLGYPVTIFSDSHDFAKRLENLHPIPDIILLDIHIQPYDGFEMLQMIRSNPRLARQTVIALTASVMNQEIAKLRQSGFDGALSKPIDFDEFPLLLQQILNGEKTWHIT